MNSRMMGRLAAKLLALSLFFPGFASAQSLTMKERIVLGSFNMCWEGEEGKNLSPVLRENGFALAPQATNNLYFRQEGNSTLLFNFYYGKDDQGSALSLCRVTALKPQIVSPWTPKEPILPAFDALLDRIIASSAKMGLGYTPAELGQPIASRPGARRSVLRLNEDKRARIIYIEEGPTYYEFAYFNASRATINDPTLVDQVIQPSARAAMQLFVDDGWETTFCNLNPHNCLTQEQQRQQQAMATARERQGSSMALPFSGIGSIRSGDNRNNEQRLRDKAWWQNYHRCGSGKC